MQQFGAIALICPWKYCSWHSRMQFPCGNETGWVTIEENWIQVCIEEKSMNFKTGNILRSLAPDNERDRKWERGRERTTEQEISMAANVMNNISSVNPANWTLGCLLPLARLNEFPWECGWKERRRLGQAYWRGRGRKGLGVWNRVLGVWFGEICTCAKPLQMWVEGLTALDLSIKVCV